MYNELFEWVLREAEKNIIKIKKTAVYRKWYSNLEDEKLKSIIRSRLCRIRKGNFGDIRPERGVSEIVIDHGPGYRIYFIKRGMTVIILLCGGDKSTQNSDIISANQMVDNLKKGFKK
jgi:putative addiction module killer protein